MNKSNFLLLIIIIFFLFLRIPQIINNNFVFVFDMGRDMLWTRDIVVLGKPYLIGPWGSLEGIFFGPLWYYLLSLPFIIFGGDPRGSVMLVLLANLGVVVGVYIFGRKVQGSAFGLICSLLVCISSLNISISTFSFHANILPLTTFIFIYSLFMFIRNKYIFLIPAALCTSLNFHFEPATAIFTTLTLVIFIILYRYKFIKKINFVFLSIIAFIFPFIPQIIFELRHNFLQTKGLLYYFKGTNQSLGGVLPLGQRFTDRIDKFAELLRGSFFNTDNKILLIIVLFVVCLLIIKTYFSEDKKIKDFIKVNIFVLIIPLISYIFLFPPELKGWYLYGLSVPFILLSGLAVYQIIKINKIIFYLFMLFLIFNNTDFINRINDFMVNESNNCKAEVLSCQINVIDWIYKDAGKDPYNVYVYTAPIYEYHYQYLFWWLGEMKYHKLPEEYSYLPGKTEYVNYKQKYLDIQYLKQNSQKPKFYYLIIEPDNFKERINSWLESFQSNPLIDDISLGDVIVQKRINI